MVMTKQKRNVPSRSNKQQAFKQAVKRAQATQFSLPETDKRICLNIGWSSVSKGRTHSHFAAKDWEMIHVDSDAAYEPDLLVPSIATLDMLEDNSVDGIWLCHVLQRITFHEAAILVRESLRVLKEGGDVIVQMPDAQLAATFIARNEADAAIYHAPAGGITPIDMMFGYQKAIAKGDTSRIHRSGYTAETLGLFLRDNDVCNLKMWRQQHDLLAYGRKFPYGHADRVERIMLHTEDAKRPNAPDSATANIAKPVRYQDRLEDAPQLWKPLGLKK